MASAQSPSLPLPDITPMFLDIWHLILPLVFCASKYIFIILDSEPQIASGFALGSGWGQLDHVIKFPPEANPLPSFIGVDVLLTHVFYGWRIFMLGKSYIIPVIVGLVSFYFGNPRTDRAKYESLLLDFGNSVCCSDLRFSHGMAISVWYINLLKIWIVFLAAADLLITAGLVLSRSAMVYFMFRERRKTTYKHTITRLENAIKFIIETGAITAVLMVVELILFLTLPNENYNYMIFFCSGKVYANALLANLNSRITFVTSATVQHYPNISSVQSTTNSLWPRSKEERIKPVDSGTQNITLHKNNTTIGFQERDGAYELSEYEGGKALGSLSDQDNAV
ncbi:hypothetical protein GYMLUDRAFT_63716 [Collybiopsis luxurians FD-317 M1]|uniref:DUF6534 domain-containing protein n=1 Tax=Collybiopsis luxurians FD-317 M1 TaxID=944289 RepID=A0A0D0CET1_9AGAR|nr:hypothetical protein GYMLUDRAFT_63716 [Collybiopsis luxurians FD-317 M1]